MNEMIIEALEESNKWWKSEFTIDFKPREIYEQLSQFINTKQIIALTGLRRVGKTTLLLKLIADNLDKFGANNICYFSFDNFRNATMKQVLNCYSQLMNKDLNTEKYFFLFDEVQKLENWEEQIKRIYDNFKNIKLAVSGSESLFIRKKSKESLAGRCFEFKINPLTFKEYLQFKQQKFENFQLYKNDILREFNNYLISSGFPELINENRETIKKYIQETVIEKIIYRDMLQIFSINNPSAVESIFRIILLSPGTILNMEQLAKELSISRQSVSNYLDYLEKSFLIKKLYNFSKNTRKTQRSLKKYYPVIFAPELVEKNELKGIVFELSIILNLDAEFFWRDQYKHEVDVIKINKDTNTILPIEIKYAKQDYGGLVAFLKRFKLKEGILISYDKKETIKLSDLKIKVMPFYEAILNSSM
ncbi:hypothetical protein COV18_00705 [Candidatus Woesearchaeota archaeon CG10_big_fil_rev_8_21_14_0_10_37_12]|nr:MAG: hypothetical protein COV18_00705 [Candidatus Woesearchaeota archaeon CG10_big_fil_rev_8_21_14_0_10_37_12]